MPSTQYLNRKYDILSLRGAVPRGEVRLNQTLFETSKAGEVCTGVQKLAQRWALEFLTRRGTMGYHLADRGTDFMTVARAGRFRTELDVQVEYNFAAVLVRQNLVNEETDDMHPEDRFASDTLNGIVLGPDYLQLYVTITSQAGTAREIILPINITPTNLTL